MDEEAIHRRQRFFGLRQVLKDLSKQLALEFQSSAVVDHAGDKGEERELFLQTFLRSGHLPSKYSISKGHGKVLASSGQTSLQTDLVLYDGFSCPILRDGEKHQFPPVSG